MKKVIFVIMISLFIIIDGWTLLLILGDMLIPTTTIEVKSQNEDIVRKVKEHFNINKDIKRIEYNRGFPDGYRLLIYDSDGDEHHVFEDRFEDSEIDDYFRKLNKDNPKHLNILLLEILIELIVITAVIVRNKNVTSHKAV